MPEPAPMLSLLRLRPWYSRMLQTKKALRRAFHQCKAEVLAVTTIAAGTVASAIAIIAGAIRVIASDLIFYINTFFCSESVWNGFRDFGLIMILL